MRWPTAQESRWLCWPLALICAILLNSVTWVVVCAFFSGVASERWFASLRQRALDEVRHALNEQMEWRGWKGHAALNEETK